MTKDIPKGTPVVQFKTPDGDTVLDDLQTLEQSLVTNHVKRQRHILLGPEQFRYIMEKLRTLELLETDIAKAKEYWQNWAALEVRKAIRKEGVDELLDALADIRDNFDHEEQTYEHSGGKYGGSCRVCLATAAIEAFTGDWRMGDGKSAGDDSHSDR